jgi:hypothetical protein
MNEAGEIVGMVDVLKLTYATLEQINTMSTGDSEGPAWNKFWLSLENETESIMSGEGSHSHMHTTGARSLMSPDMSRHERLVDNSVAPGDSASHTGADSPAHSAITGPVETPAEEIPFSFKFKAPSGRVHRLQVVAAHGMNELIYNVIAKLGPEVDAVGGIPSVDEGRLGASGFALSYLDDDGDTVSLTTDNDLLEAIVIARQGRRDKVDLFVHDPSSPPISATLDLQPPVVPAQEPTPPPSTLRERRKHVSDEDESEDDVPVRRSRKGVQQPMQEQVIAGVPNELLLPGAIVTLAVVIVGVFTLTRISSR